MFVFFTVYDYFIMGYHTALTASGMKQTALVCLVAGLFVGTALWFNIKRKVRLLEADIRR